MKTWRLHARTHLAGIVAGAFVLTYGAGPGGIALAYAGDPAPQAPATGATAHPAAAPTAPAPSATGAATAPAAAETEPAAPPAPPPSSDTPVTPKSPADVTPEPSPLADTAAPPPKPMARRSLAPAFITGGLAIASVAVGTVFGVLALNEKNKFNTMPTASTADAGENDALVADMAFGIALTLGVTSLVLFLDKDDDFQEGSAKNKAKPPSAVAAKRPSPIKIVPTPIVTRNGGGLGAVIRF